MSKPGPKRSVRRADVLGAIEATEPYRPRTTSDLADELGQHRDPVYDRLRELHELGHVETKKVGARGRVWWVPRPAATDVADVPELDRSVNGRAIRVPADDVYAVLRSREDVREPWSAPEVADALDCSSDPVLNRLHDLHDDSRVATMEVAARDRAWWVRPGDRLADADQRAPVPAGDD